MSTKLLQDATETSLGMLKDKLNEAEETASLAQAHWMDAEAAASALRDEVDSVSRALAVLRGEEPAARTTSEPVSGDSTQDSESQVDGGGDSDVQEETPEEFEARLKQERHKRKKERENSGPYAGIQCNGCGGIGTLYDSLQTVGVRQAPVIACTGCKSVKRR